MNFKKRVNGSWTNIPHYIHNTSTDTLTTLPADIYANDTTATVGLKGNMQQTGSPTPQNPIQPQSCGERTGNLAHNNREKGYTLDTTTGLPVLASSTSFMYWCFMTPIAKVEVGDKFILSIDIPTSNFWFTYSVVDNGVMQTRSSGNGNKIAATLQKSGDLYISCYAYNSSESIIDEAMKTIMINFGSTPLPYEPYGYKIPISSAGQTTPVYLGEVETTRKIKKLVLTGEELFTINASGNNTYFACALIKPAIRTQAEICTHLTYATIVASNTDVGFSIIANGTELRIRIPNAASTSLADFKAYLAAQYAAGTPVTVWYVLAETTTGIVNEPIRKIGEYADTVSGITIPTIAGANALDVLTTLKPSEVTVNYKGWHPVQSVHERENGAWT